MNTVHIAKVETVGTGGNCMADLIHLKNGKLICISDEALGVFDNPNDFFNVDGNGVVENCREMELLDSGFTREGPQSADCNLTFVDYIETYEPDGPVSVDLLQLKDGRVLGIDSDSAVLYGSMEDFDDLDGGGSADGSIEL